MGQPFELLVLELLAGEPEPPRLVEGGHHPGLEVDPGLFGGLGRGRGQSGHRRITAVDDHRPEGDAHFVLELVRGLDGLVDRHLLGQGDQGHLAA